ncbi:MAG: outer membrane beta-barrel protein [Longimicrobiales bacterium]|nr:outer membrane beta-barrel protein [Longimicrobiales bacterium]
MRSSFVVTMVLAVAFASAAPLAAQARAGDGFLFAQPRVSLKFETGYGFQRAQGDIFDFVIEEHTLERSDFSSPYFGGEIGFRVDERWDVAIGVGFQKSSTRSEFRDLIGTDGLPIEQVTELRLVPVVASAKYYLKPRGRSIGRFAWIPETVVPYVSGGVGMMSYRFEQDGEFVDYETYDIFYDNFRSERQTFLVRAAAGVDITVGERFVLNGEARYNYARGELSDDFSGFGDIDLDGLQLTAGISIRF